jgi:hypothetical protein
MRWRFRRSTHTPIQVDLGERYRQPAIAVLRARKRDAHRLCCAKPARADRLLETAPLLGRNPLRVPCRIMDGIARVYLSQRHVFHIWYGTSHHENRWTTLTESLRSGVDSAESRTPIPSLIRDILLLCG